MDCRRALASAPPPTDNSYFYISIRNEVQLIAKSLETLDTRNSYGVPFQIFYGISDNSCRFWDISNVKRVIGYEPEDDSVVLFRDQIMRITAD